MLRRAICHQIFSVEFLGRGNQPSHFAAVVGKERTYLHQEEDTKHKVCGFGFFHVCTARLDVFGTSVQLVQIGVTALIFN